MSHILMYLLCYFSLWYLYLLFGFLETLHLFSQFLSFQGNSFFFSWGLWNYSSHVRWYFPFFSPPTPAPAPISLLGFIYCSSHLILFVQLILLSWLKFFLTHTFTYKTERNSLAIHWLGLCAVIARAWDSIPGQRTKIPQTIWCSQKKKILSVKNVITYLRIFNSKQGIVKHISTL